MHLHNTVNVYVNLLLHLCVGQSLLALKNIKI